MARRSEGKHVTSVKSGPGNFEAKHSMQPKRWRKIKGERRSERSVKLRWFVLASVFLVLCIMIYGIVAHFLDGNRKNEAPSTNLSVQELPVPDVARLPKLADEAESVHTGDPLAVARAFAEAGSVEARLALARDPEGVRARLESYPDQAVSEQPKAVLAVGLNTNGVNQYPVYKAGFDNGEARLIAVVATPDGLKVDWDAYARTGSATWEDFMSGKVKEATFRVFVARGNYYNFDYADDEKWRCYQMFSPDFPDPIYGFAEAYGETAIALAEALRDNGAKQERMILTLRASNPENLTRRQIHIVSVVSRGWVEGLE